VIGNDKIIMMVTKFKFRNRVINPNFLNSVLESGKVCIHLKAFPDIKELVVKRPNRKTYINNKTKNTLRNRL
jgi:hypothetical protein